MTRLLKADTLAVLGELERQEEVDMSIKAAMASARAEIEKLKDKLHRRETKISKLETAAKDHVAALAHACDGYVPIKDVSAQMAKVEEHKELHTELSKVKADAATREKEFAKLEKQLSEGLEEKSRELTVVNQRYNRLEEDVMAYTRRILGCEEKVLSLNAATRLKAVVKCVLSYTSEAMAVVQYLSPTERIQHTINEVMANLNQVPAVVDWMRRSAFRRGVTMALSMTLAHYPDMEVAEVTSGFPGGDGEVDHDAVMALLARVAPYADRVLSFADLDDHQASQVAPEDADGPAPTEVDYLVDKPIAAACGQALSTYEVSSWSVIQNGAAANVGVTAEAIKESSEHDDADGDKASGDSEAEGDAATDTPKSKAGGSKAKK